jgi:hypothetical protein
VNSQLDKVYSADPIKATQKQIDFIIDNMIYLPVDKKHIIKTLDKLGKKEATELISLLIEIKNEEEKEFDKEVE